MIHHVRKTHAHGNYAVKPYLSQWFYQDILIVTDLDIWAEEFDDTSQKHRCEKLIKLLDTHPCKNVVVDLSQNCFPLHQLPDELRGLTTLTSTYDEWYNQSAPNIHFFPIYMYMYSHRINFNQMHRDRFDALGTKTHGVMCLNRGGRKHRIKFYELIKNYKDQMCLTVPVADGLPWQDNRLSGDTFDPDGVTPINDVGVGHPVYDQYAVNVVTETQIDFPSITEKCCKPFIARQIPIIVGNAGVNQFHVDIGFDMFEDLVPWRTWDNQPDVNIRLELIANFVKKWIDSNTILRDYHQVQDRIERNKQYFHSDRFRDLVMKNMPKIDPYQSKQVVTNITDPTSRLENNLIHG
jgi:hypothetical protein